MGFSRGQTLYHMARNGIKKKDAPFDDLLTLTVLRCPDFKIRR